MTTTYGTTTRPLKNPNPTMKNVVGDTPLRRSRSLSFGKPSSSRTLGVSGLAILTFYSVSGGPFGSEATVSYSSPLFTLLGYLIFPLLWSVPEALVVAELSSTYPESSGFVAWVEVRLNGACDASAQRCLLEWPSWYE